MIPLYFNNIQATFNHVVTELLKQNKKSMGPKTTEITSATYLCKYRGDDGSKCAFGHVIPDTEYNPSMEGKDITSILNWDGESTNVDYNYYLFVKRLQNIHDGNEVREWPSRFINIGNEFSLELPTALKDLIPCTNSP